MEKLNEKIKAANCDERRKGLSISELKERNLKLMNESEVYEILETTLDLLNNDFPGSGFFYKYYLTDTRKIKEITEMSVDDAYEQALFIVEHRYYIYDMFKEFISNKQPN